MIQFTDKIKAWVDGVALDQATYAQISNMSRLPIVDGHVAVMPDAHLGKGSCVGTVIPTRGALIPAAVGVDIGCGMGYVRLNMKADGLDRLPALRHSIERAVPVGAGKRGEGEFWFNKVPARNADYWQSGLEADYKQIIEENPKLDVRIHPIKQLGTLGGGNHFIEIVKDQDGYLGVMLHSGSRGVGNRIGSYFIEQAQLEARVLGTVLVDKDLAWLDETRPSFAKYVQALLWSQRYAMINRRLMMDAVLGQLYYHLVGPDGTPPEMTMEVYCHHNYTEKVDGAEWLEEAGPINLYITRKGAVSARVGELVIIPSAMGQKSYIAEGLGNRDSHFSCSHGAGRLMSRGKAKDTFTVDDLRLQTEGVECRKDAGVLDEIPGCYKPIDAVMAAQADLVRPVLELEALICVKG